MRYPRGSVCLLCHVRFFPSHVFNYRSESWSRIRHHQSENCVANALYLLEVPDAGPLVVLEQLASSIVAVDTQSSTDWSMLVYGR